MGTGRHMGLWLGRESTSLGHSHPGMPDLGVGFKVLPMKLGVSEHLGSGAATGMWDAWDEVQH